MTGRPTPVAGGIGRTLGLAGLAYSTIGAGTVAPESVTSAVADIEAYVTASNAARESGTDAAYSVTFLRDQVKLLNIRLAEAGEEFRINGDAAELAAVSGKSYADALAQLVLASDDAYRGVKKYNPELDELSDASLAARNAMKSQYEWTKLLNNETKRGAPFFRSMSEATGILASDIRELADAAAAAYAAYFGTGGGGGGGGGPSGVPGGGGGGTRPNRDPRTDRRRFNRASEYERYAAR